MLVVKHSYFLHCTSVLVTMMEKFTERIEFIENQLWSTWNPVKFIKYGEEKEQRMFYNRMIYNELSEISTNLNVMKKWNNWNVDKLN